MNLVDEYRKQSAWRDCESVYNRLPIAAGQLVLDIGCGVGDQAAALVARGARVIGFDILEELLAAARARDLKHAQFRNADLRQPLNVSEPTDGVWCSFTPAYFVDLPAALASWTSNLRSGGWVALVEIDDFFAHEPLAQRTRALFDQYAREALEAGRYDFHMGRKLAAYARQAGLRVEHELDLPDLELSFNGPARPDVIDAWGARLDRMKLLQQMCAGEFQRLRDDFLSCLARPDHRSIAKVRAVIAAK